MRSAVCLRCAYGILCKEKRGDSWITVAAVAPFSDGLEAVARTSAGCGDGLYYARGLGALTGFGLLEPG